MKKSRGCAVMGAPSSKADIADEPSRTPDNSLPEHAKWSRIVCIFPNVKQWDQTGSPPHPLPGVKGTRLILKDNPGEYEMKVLWKNKLARSIKFTIRPDGTLDNGISAANKMDDEKAIVPVTIIGDQDGNWNHGV